MQKILQKSILLLLVSCVLTVASSCRKQAPEPEIELLTVDKTAFFSPHEKKVWTLVNEHRGSIGLKALEADEFITQVCREHSKDMADGTVPFGHHGVSGRFARIDEKHPHSRAGENVYYGANSDPAAEAVKRWLNSPGHRANIEGDYNMTGIGLAEKGGYYYFTQIFIKK